ncbi:hypothetical protein JKP88DRAFT_248314 [Tribonema minus]|uniref:Uncharacterized protein n=1 Tax=Tribonema minus TaxID=303371 RepID=A0A835YMT0_9STRA|nr:hypothetical protein JKP88DRAFT_248314 [Tribonema minus]
MADNECQRVLWTLVNLCSAKGADVPASSFVRDISATDKCDHHISPHPARTLAHLREDYAEAVGSATLARIRDHKPTAMDESIALQAVVHFESSTCDQLAAGLHAWHKAVYYSKDRTHRQLALGRMAKRSIYAIRAAGEGRDGGRVAP